MMHRTLFISLILCFGCKIQNQPLTTRYESNSNSNEISISNDIKAEMEDITSNGVPGMAIAVISPEGAWEYATGLSKVEENLKMQTCHLHYLQSIAKSYLGTAILMLLERGEINIDQKMTAYWPELKDYFDRADDITIRMLLNHTSGLPEYNDDPSYVSILLQNPNESFNPIEYLDFIKGKELRFEPESRRRYTNTNFLILALIMDKITGDHAQFIRTEILEKLGLDDTFYRSDENYLNYPAIYNAYWDRYSDGHIENISLMQRTNVQSMIGDDGIVATPMDAVRFLKGLMSGQLISNASIEEMKKGFVEEDGFVGYGLGLDIGEFSDFIGYGHSGGGIGAGCQLYYFPHNDTYFFLGINLGTVTGSPLHKKLEPSLDRIHQLLTSGN